MSHTVLVGVDGSGPSDAATHWAIERAARLGLRMDLLHASKSGDASRGAFLLDRAVMTARSYPGVAAVRGFTVDGDAMEELITASSGAAIVVVGSHKTGFLRGRVFGSQSLRLVAGALCPVAIIPESSGRVRRGVAVGVSGTPASGQAVRFAAEEAAALDEDLFLINGDQTATTVETDVAVATRSDLLLAAARDLAITVAPSVTVRLRSVRRSAAVALADASPSSVLLVLAASSGEGADGALGPTTHDVLMNLAGPTVVVPA
ncbi:Nucleotide-binding universal stress protein, UspA family [Rathayibacter oskolensis]|uniref:Nucleotide-binding universal stress protein, UspA family n=1 Tax=Rathayibacter oskolensis TaxID=1891671 RepID=A0A1X7PCB5_9MICO|nr:universal stress protein [Rathayibacter oskolensis]SMH48343.1 Nucleotide-binding universal stress protein, UspA family [Rathayibacter oskolensis]